MHFEANHVYHLYNRGNNKQTIFFSHENYLYFRRKVRNEWLPFCDILAYCLMPNHFHFLIVPKEEACKNIIINEKETHMQVFSKTIGKTLSSYTKAINLQQQTTGNLFQKKTKAKILIPDKIMINQFSQRDYQETCFHYIHLNPFVANLVTNMNDWPYSSWPDFYGLRNRTLINKKMLMELLGYSQKDFENFTQKELNPLLVKNIF